MRGKTIVDAILGTRRRQAALVLLLAILVAVPIGALLTPDASDVNPTTADETDAASSSSLPEAPPADLALVRDSLRQAAQAHGADYEPVPPPEPSSQDPLHEALDEWLETRLETVPDDVRQDAHAQADEVPRKLHEPLARLLLAHAEASRLQSQALSSLSEQERARIGAIADQPEDLAATVEDPPPWFRHAAAKVDLQRSFQAAHLLVDAADATLPELRSYSEDLARPNPSLAASADDPTATPPLLTAAAQAPASELGDLDGLLEALGGDRPAMQPPATAPLSEQLDDGSDDGSSAPAPVQELPASLDDALGSLWFANTAGAHLLATEGPDALLDVHLLRVRAMQQSQPTLEAWGTAMDGPSTDARHLARPTLAAGAALDRAADVPGPETSPHDLLAFSLTDGEASPPSAGGDPVDALGDLYEAADAAPPEGWRDDARGSFDAISEDRRRGLAILLHGLAEARAQTEAALSGLSPDERQHILDHGDDVQAFLAGERLSEQRASDARQALHFTEQIDRTQLASAALTSGAAIDKALPHLATTQTAHGSDDVDPPEECPQGAPGADCERGIAFRDPLGLVVVGSADGSVHDEPTGTAPIALIDLGGDDTYTAPVADGDLFRPLSVGLDLGGEDRFTTAAAGQGRGTGALGLLVQAGGDTTYETAQRGQGYGAAGGGIGALLDLGGDDDYQAQALAQAAAQPLDEGTGILVDTGGDDRYTSARGIGFSAGSTFLDLGGRDRYVVDDLAHGARLDQGVDLDDVPERVFQQRRDNSLWLDGTFTLDTSLGLDVDAAKLDHDDDRFPTLVEILADTHADNGAQTPVDQAEGAADAGQDGDDDGSPHAVEEAAGTDPEDGNESALALPSGLPLVPEEANELYHELRDEHAEGPPPNGLLLDVRMPLDDRTGYECPTDELYVCTDLEGPSDGTTTTDTGFDTTDGFDVGPARIIIGARGELATETRAEMGLLALGSPANSTYELPYLLSVDLGGEDTYEAGAGGAIEVETEYETASLSPEEERALVPTMHLDLAGEDRYLGEDHAQGAGGGVLVDLDDGDDVYEGGAATQGARGGLLFDEAGDDTYEARAGSQGAALPTLGFAALVPLQAEESTATRLVRQAYATAYAAGDAPSIRPSLAVDGEGEDRRRAGDASQGFAGMTPANTTLDAASFPVGSSSVGANETILAGGIVDVDGDDGYRAGDRSQATTAPNGLAFLADRSGDDDYTAGGLVSQAGIDTRALTGDTSTHTQLPGLALLLDTAGADTYQAHPQVADNRSRTDEREGNVTHERTPLGDGGTQTSMGGVRLAAMHALHADLEASDRDSDGDGWGDLLETLAGTSGDDDGSRPASTVLQDGRVIDLPQAGLVVGGIGDDTYTHDKVLALDLGGANTYENNAGGPILDPLARDLEADGLFLTTSDVDDSGRAATTADDAYLFEHPVTAVFDAGAEGSTFQAPGDLTQASSLFTVGVVMTTGGNDTFQAPSQARPLAEIPEGPRASLDGLVGVKEYPNHEEIVWNPDVDPTRERNGEVGLVHDEDDLFLSGRILEQRAPREDELPELTVHFATFNETPTLIDRLLLSPENGGRLVDQHWDAEEEEWADDELDDETPTRVRMNHVDDGWTFEIARPMDDPSVLGFEAESSRLDGLLLELCQPARVLDSGPFTDVTVTDGGHRIELRIEHAQEDEDLQIEAEELVEIKLEADEPGLAFERWHWLRGDSEVDGETADGCQLFDTEDVPLSAGQTVQTFLTFEDKEGEVWRFPSAAAADGERRFPANDDLADELSAWLPLHARDPDVRAPNLTTGPRLTQGASVAGVGLLTSVSMGTGDDTYEAHRQAQAYGTARGTGLLVDLGGPDTYTLESDGQAAATQEGLALLLDHHGNDRYAAEKRAQGYATEPLSAANVQLDVANAELLDQTPGRGSLVDLGGYDHYDPDAKRTLTPLPVPSTTSYRTQVGNDRAWQQGEGGLGLDTALASHGPRAGIGDSTLAEVDVEAWPAEADGECPRQRPPANERLDWHANHSLRLAEEEICLAVTVDDPIVDNMPLRRIEVLLDGRREIVHDVRQGPEEVDEWPLSSDRSLLVFPLDTSEHPDGPVTFHAIAYYDAPRPEGPIQEATWGPLPPVIAEATTRVAISNPPSIEEFELRAEAASPTPAIGEPGLSFEARLAEDLSEHETELSGYGKTRDNVACPFDEDRTCDRYTLYLDDGSMRSHRPDDTVPNVQTTDAGDRNTSTTYVHELRTDVLLAGGEAMGAVDDRDSDLWLSLAHDAGILQIAESGDAVYAERTTAGEASPGDLRLTEAAQRPPGSLVQAGDPDVGETLTEAPNASVSATDGTWSPDDPLHLDLDPAVEGGPAVLLANGTSHGNGTYVDEAPSRLVPVDGMQPSGWNATEPEAGDETVYIDTDASTSTTPGDVRLGATHVAPNASAQLAYHHKPLYQGEVDVHVKLSTGVDGEAAPIVANQTHPIFAQAHGRADVAPESTPAAGPAADDVDGWSSFWLPADDTRVYAHTANDPTVNHELRLDVSTAFEDTEGNGDASSRLSCATQLDALLIPRGLCNGLALDGGRTAPSRLHLYVPADTDQRLVFNATPYGEDDNLTFRTDTLGGDRATVTWPAEDADDGLYNVSLNALEPLPNVTSRDGEHPLRWTTPVQGPTVRIDGEAPNAEVALPAYIGTSLIDSFTRTFRIPWDVDDPGEVEELRVFAAPGSSPDDEEWELVEEVNDPDRGSVDYEFDADEDSFSLSIVAMDEAGNVEEIDDNFWPTQWPEGGRCPAPLPDDVSVWPTGTDEVFPDLRDHCFQNEASAKRAAFLAGLDEGRSHTVTIDRSSPFVRDVDLELPAREGPREVRVDGRPVLGLAGGEPAVPTACASDEGPAPIAEVNLFWLRKADDGDTIENSHSLNETTDGCYAFHELEDWTDDEDRYPEGFWTAGVEVVDAAGNTAEAFLGTVYIDQASPTVTEGGVQLPAGQLAVTPGQTITVDGVMEDATGIADAHIDAPAFNASSPVELAVEDGEVEGALAIDRDTGPGVYDVYLNVTDALGNELVQHREVPVNLTPTEIVEGPRLTQLANGSAEDEAPLSTVPGGIALSFETSTPSRFRVLAGADEASLAPVHLHEGNFTTEHDVTVTDLTPGQRYVVQIEAFSEGGLTDTSAPLRVQAGPAFATELRTPTAGGVLGPNTTIAWETIEADNASIGEDVSALVSLRRSPNATFHPVGGQTHAPGNASLDVDLSGFPSGTSYALRLQSLAGSQRALTLVEPLTVDTAAPSVSMVDPRQGWTNATAPDVTLALEDALAGLPADPVLEARVDGEAVPASATDNGSRVELSLDDDLTPGSHRIELVVQDRVGNEATRSLPLNVDDEAPTMRLTKGPNATVRPGGQLPVEVYSRDDGVVDHVEARLGASHVEASDPGGLDRLKIPVPTDVRPGAQLTVAVADLAGNQLTETASLTVDAQAPRVLDLNASAGVAHATLRLQADEPVDVVASTGNSLAGASLAEEHSLELDRLRPDTEHRIQLRVSDEAGNTVQRTTQVTTVPDEARPTAPPALAVDRLPNGTIAIDWAPAEDDGDVAVYRVARSSITEQAWQDLGQTRATHLLDHDPDPGTTYRYRVQAVDLVGQAGEPAHSPEIQALAAPELAAPDVSTVDDADAGTYHFEVTYRHPAGQLAEAVHLVLDGSRVPMDPAGQAEDGQVYATQVSLDPHTPTGAHSYRFEAHTAEPTMRTSLPEHGEFTGPLVSTLDDDGAVTTNPLPVPPLAAILGLLAAAGALQARRDR